MSNERDRAAESFFSRWSRLKHAPAAQPVALPADALATAPADVQDEAPQLPAIEELTIDSDFRGFLHPKVDENVRRDALRKLFTDPHFNVMDGLDVYIDDYSKPDPIPPEMLAGLRQAQRIMEWAAEKKDDAVKPDCETLNAVEPAGDAGAEAVAVAAPEPSDDYSTRTGSDTARVGASREATPD